jgi:regulator of replication initiation timing
MQKEKLVKILGKASEIEKNQAIAVAKNFIALEEKVDAIKEELKKKLERELVLEIDKEELKGDIGEQGEKGKDGKDGKAGKIGKTGKTGKAGKDGKDGIDGIDGKDGEKIIIEKITNIPPVKDIETLKNQIKEIEELIKKLPKVKGSIYSAVAALKSITAGDNISVDNTIFGHPVVSFTGFSGLNKITVSATEPSNPSVGDLWVELT